MFSAIANFLFGGEKLEPMEKEEPVEYSTREAEEPDWLLVDVSDREQSEEKENVPEEDDDEEDDDVLSSLPFLLSQESLQHDVPAQQPLPVSYSQDCFLLTPSSCLVSEFPLAKFSALLPTERYVSLQEINRACSTTVLNDLISNLVNIELSLTSHAMVMKRDLPRPVDVNKVTTVSRPVLTKPEKSDKRQTHPAELSEAFWNPQLPQLPTPKNESVPQIKDLRPAQQAKEYEIKKRQKRNLLNRQNRVYLYESSNKNQHRRDLWQRHSGANNNRKCC